ncbi:MAG: conserved exported protein of unknown function [Candidatus Thorarchaeota archaeon]|nr:MAG: conserved exported protein of unknown function [Candidatus Thorarchaeota archaeon]
MRRIVPIALLMVFLLASPLAIASSEFFQTTTTERKVIGSKSDTSLSTINTATDDWKMSHVENGRFENWNNPHDPDSFGDFRTTEHFTWYASNPWPVNEGSKSFGMQVKAVDEYHHSEAQLNPNPQSQWDNPTNLTISFDYFLDAIWNPSEVNFFHLELRMKEGFASKYLHYYMKGASISSNSTSYAYFNLDSPLDQWNSFNRNITEDFFEVFGAYPSAFTTMYFYLQTEESAYSRVFVDDFYLVNGTVRIGGSVNNGNFEGSGTWYSTADRDPGDISQTTEKQEGNWAINMTTLSRGNESNAEISFGPTIRLTSDNQDRLEFPWKIDDWQVPDVDSYIYMQIEMANNTHEFHLFYWFCYVGTSAPIQYEGYNAIHVDDFNSTGTWNYFNRSIWEDVTALNTTTELVIEHIEIHMECREPGSRLVFLMDDMRLMASALNDRDYEDQLDVGTPIRSWGTSGIDEDPNLLVTDFAYSGNKAANLTLTDNTAIWMDQELKERALNSTTELYLDFNWYLDDFSALENDEILIYVSFYDYNIYYVLATGRSSTYGGEGDAYIMLPEANQTGTWINTQINLYQDFYDTFEESPISIDYVAIEGDTDAGGKLEIIFDDFYLYEGSAPIISDVKQTPLEPNPDENVDVYALVEDSALDTVWLEYRVDGGTWSGVVMTETVASNYTATIPFQTWNSEIEYRVVANDTFEKVSSSSDGTDYHTYTVVDTVAPTIVLNSITNESTVSGDVSLIATVDGTGSDIVRVEFYVDDVLVSNDTSAAFSFTWETANEDDGNHVIVAKTFDQAGNSAEVLYILTVDNQATETTSTTTTTPTTPEQTPLDPTVLILVGALLAIALVVVYFVVIRPKQTSS